MTIDHDGYADPDSERSAARIRANRRILQREIELNPHDASLFYYIAVEQTMLGHNSAALFEP